jgi:hypothetical protein
MTAETELIDALGDVVHVLHHTGRHAKHMSEQVGKCVQCSCGIRVQGRLVNTDAPSADSVLAGPAEPDTTGD